MDIIGLISLIVGIGAFVFAVLVWCYSAKPPSDCGKKVISKIAHEEFPNPDQYQEWATFDLNFVETCLGKTHRGLTFKGDICNEFLSKHPLGRNKLKIYFGKSAKIYARCSKIRTWRCKDREFFIKLALVYADLEKKW